MYIVQSTPPYHVFSLCSFFCVLCRALCCLLPCVSCFLLILFVAGEEVSHRRNCSSFATCISRIESCPEFSSIFAATSSAGSVVLLAASLFIWSFCRPVVVPAFFYIFFILVFGYVLGIVVGRLPCRPKLLIMIYESGGQKDRDRHPGPTRGKYKWNFKMWSDLIMHGKSKEDSQQGRMLFICTWQKQRQKRQPAGPSIRTWNRNGRSRSHPSIW